MNTKKENDDLIELAQKYGLILQGDLTLNEIGLDFRAHLLVNDESTITGVLDWTEAAVNDPSIDFIFHLMAFGDHGLELLIKHYEKAGGQIWDGMRAQVAEQLAAFPIKFALYAIVTGKDEMIGSARAQMAVG